MESRNEICKKCGWHETECMCYGCVKCGAKPSSFIPPQDDLTIEQEENVHQVNIDALEAFVNKNNPSIGEFVVLVNGRVQYATNTKNDTNLQTVMYNAVTTRRALVMFVQIGYEDSTRFISTL
jgi:hypothetical protein